MRVQKAQIGIIYIIALCFHCNTDWCASRSPVRWGYKETKSTTEQKAYGEVFELRDYS